MDQVGLEGPDHLPEMALPRRQVIGDLVVGHGRKACRPVGHDVAHAGSREGQLRGLEAQRVDDCVLVVVTLGAIIQSLRAFGKKLGEVCSQVGGKGPGW